MALFDFDAGLQGAGTGATVSGGNPIGAAAGFVIGGLVGGRNEKKRRQAKKKREAELRAAMDAKRRYELTQQLLPLYRNLIASGPGAAKQGEVASALGRMAYTGTGVGQAMKDASRALPGVEALRLATDDARDLQRNQIAALSGQAFDPYPYQNWSQFSPGELAQVGTVFTGLGARNKPTAAADATLFPDLYGPNPRFM